MISDSIETREVVIELILSEWDGVFPVDCPRLDVNYFFEDRRGSEAGVAISDDMPLTGNVNKAIVDFLTPILKNAEALRVFLPILRIFIYNKAFSCSINIKCLPLIALFGAELDIRVYPTVDDDLE
jgi:hypothetical protein